MCLASRVGRCRGSGAVHRGPPHPALVAGQRVADAFGTAVAAREQGEPLFSQASMSAAAAASRSLLRKKPAHEPRADAFGERQEVGRRDGPGGQELCGLTLGARREQAVGHADMQVDVAAEGGAEAVEERDGAEPRAEGWSGGGVRHETSDERYVTRKNPPDVPGRLLSSYRRVKARLKPSGGSGDGRRNRWPRGRSPREIVLDSGTAVTGPTTIELAGPLAGSDSLP
jgi:hypothetical protein